MNTCMLSHPRSTARPWAATRPPAVETCAPICMRISFASATCALHTGERGVALNADIEPLIRDWEDLARRCGAAPFLYPGWIMAWNRAFGGGAERVATLRDGGRLVALLPLLRRRGALASATNWHTPLFSPLAEDEEAGRRLLSGVLASEPPCLDLAFLDAEDRLLSAHRDCVVSAGYRALERVIQRSPYVPISGDWDSYESGISGRRLSKYRRFRRRLDEQGRVEIEVHSGNEGLDAALEDGFAVEAAGWKGEHGTAIRSRPETDAFYREIARWAADMGWLRLWFMRLDGRAIAFSYAIQTAVADYELKVGYDPEFARVGPGVLLTQARLRNAFESGLQSFEFLGQPDSHKLDWTDTCRTLVRVQAFAPSFRGTVSRVAWQHGRPLAQRLAALVGR